MPKFVAILGEASGLDRLRCREHAALLERLGRLAGEGQAAASPSPPAPALLRLAGAGRLAFEIRPDGGVEVFHLPSREAAETLLQPDAAGFPKPVEKRHREAVRRSAGALFRFPAEEGEGAVTVFITDWSPCPAACAVAVHRGHPFAAGLAPDAGEASFTGRYVRHPLTGDLLPVWVAGWVRPDFGTGAVLVNPAHDATDLAFGRRVGLPIRFALAPPEHDGGPAGWAVPPVVRSGRAVRTGPWDGLEPAEAMERYFEVLAGRGLAERHTDLAVGRRRIARLAPAGEGERGELAWDAGRRKLAAIEGAPEGAAPVRVEEAELVSAALAFTDGDALLCPAAEQKEALLTFRLLVCDLASRPPVPGEVITVGKVQETAVEAPAEVLRLGALLGAPAGQPVTLNQQLVDRAARFLRVHRELEERVGAVGPGTGAEASSEPPPKALQGVKRALAEGDAARAFSLLSQVQKDLAAKVAAAGGGGDRAASAFAAGYFAAAWAMAGLEPPAGVDVDAVWAEL